MFETSTEFQRFVLNKVLDFKSVCTAYKINIRSSKSGLCFCPFHYNKNTPSAKVYSDCLYCFSENKKYSICDLFDYQIISESIMSVYDNIWKILDDYIKTDLKKSFENKSVVSYNGYQKAFACLRNFKTNKIDYGEYCSNLLQCLKKLKT